MRRGIPLLITVLACGGSQKRSVGDAPENAKPSAACDATDCVQLGDRAADANHFGEALAFYSKGCDLNLAMACGNASMMIFGGGVNQDTPKGYALMIKGCELNDSRACNNAGTAWSEGKNGASGVDHIKARGFYDKSCSLNNGMGCFNLGNVFRVGEGVPVDLKAALGHFKKSCDLNEAMGCTELGIIYYEGKVVPQDVALAKQLFERACKLGSETSCRNLGLVNRASP